jgi:hypothetical protein
VSRLILNQNSSFESGVSPWTAGANATIAQSNAIAYAGKSSLQLTATAAVANVQADSENTIPVVTGQTYTASGFFTEVGSSNIPSGEIVLSWLNAGGGFISSINTGSLLQLGTGIWRGLSVTGVAPALAARAQLTCLGIGAPTLANGNTMYWDFVALVQGSSAAGGLAGLTQVSLSPPPGVIWEINMIATSDGTILNASVCTIFSGGLAIPQNYAGAVNTSQGQILPTQPVIIYPGQSIIAQWNGGDIGSNAVFTIYGNAVSGYRGRLHLWPAGR